MANVRRRKKKQPKKFQSTMRVKLIILFGIIAGLMLFLIFRLLYIEQKSGDKYEKIVLSQQEYSSKTLPYRRGDIVDRNGTILATSIDVYNVILDCKVLLGKDSYLDPTVAALVDCFDFDGEEIRQYVAEHPDSQYYVLAKRLPYEKVEKFETLMNDEENGSNIKGIWFEKEYVRSYPYESLASTVLGFTASGNVGIGGLEDEYNEVLNGTNGREYGYLNSDSNFEKTIKEAVDGHTVVSTLDATIQSIVEEKILAYNEEHKDGFEPGPAAENIAVIVMDPDTSEVLAMANYPDYDLSDPWDLSGRYSEEYIDYFLNTYYTDSTFETFLEQYSEDYCSGKEISALTEEELAAAKENAILNKIWQNYCVTYTYEPGSTFKPFTLAAGLETGTIKGDETYYCDGYELFGAEERRVNCNKRSGHGEETVKKAIMDSCNDALMQMSYTIGAENFLTYQNIFGFGLKTNIDLPGETRTDSLLYTIDTITDIDLATNSFGQNFNVTMIQMANSFCSLINGGYLNQAHVVKEIQDASGNTVDTTEPVLLKQTISRETSETLKEYLKAVVEEGTGKTAGIEGYSIGGKTGTAEKGNRDDDVYLVSFMGFAPAEDPEVLVYVVVDHPNLEGEAQANSHLATEIFKNIMEEILPYMNIYPESTDEGDAETVETENN